MHWEPLEHMQWFVDNGICSRKRPNKKFQLLYEWVEDEVDECGFILATEVREQAGVLLMALGSTRSLSALVED